MESLKGQAHGLGLYPAGSGEPLRVIEQGVTFVLTRWLILCQAGKILGGGVCRDNQR